MIIWRSWVQSLVAFNFCALNQTTESAQVRAKWISARTPHKVRAESVDCAQSAQTGCGLHRTPHSPHRTGSDPWGSVNYWVFDSVFMEIAFVSSGVKTIFSETSEYLSHMFTMEFWIVGVDEDIIQVENNTDIKHVGEDIVHKSLKSGWSIGESERHD